MRTQGIHQSNGIQTLLQLLISRMADYSDGELKVRLQSRGLEGATWKCFYELNRTLITPTNLKANDNSNYDSNESPCCSK